MENITILQALSANLFLSKLERFRGNVFQVIKAVREFHEACDRIDEMMMYQRINEWEGNWILSVPDYF